MRKSPAAGRTAVPACPGGCWRSGPAAPPPGPDPPGRCNGSPRYRSPTPGFWGPRSGRPARTGPRQSPPGRAGLSHRCRGTGSEDPPAAPQRCMPARRCWGTGAASPLPGKRPRRTPRSGTPRTAGSKTPRSPSPSSPPERTTVCSGPPAASGPAPAAG